MYNIVIKKKAFKVLKNLAADAVNKIYAKIEKLKRTPRPRGCKKLSGKRNLFRVRVGDYRIIYTIDDKEQLVIVLIIGQRKDIYDVLLNL